MSTKRWARSSGTGNGSRCRVISAVSQRQARAAAALLPAVAQRAGTEISPHRNGRNVAGSGTGQGETQAPARRARSPSVRGLYPQASALKIAYEAAAIGAAPRT